MKRIVRPLLAIALVLSASGVNHARADFVPWSYNWEPSALVIKAGGASTGGLDLTDEPSKHADGTSDVVVTNIRAFSSAARSTPDTIDNSPISFKLLLTDELSKQTGALTFAGLFNGSISATSANVKFTATAPLTQTLKLGANTYTINLGSYSPPGPPDASNSGSLSANVAVDEFTAGGGGGGSSGGGGSGAGGGTHNAPEPSTLLLSCLGLAGTGFAGWRKWRQWQTPPTAL